MTARAFGKPSKPASGAIQRARKLVGGFAALGMHGGDIVAVMLRNDAAYLDIILACRIGGCNFRHITWRSAADELARTMNETGARILFIHEDLLPGVQAALPASLTIIAVPSPHDARQTGDSRRSRSGRLQ
ncbi:MAG: hypothetical protein ACREX0_12005 [Noviherbaspirillum sp.]